MQLSDPRIDMKDYHELLYAVRLLISEDRCEGRFVHGRQLPVAQKVIVKKKVAGEDDGGENAKTDLQTVLARAGHGAPVYKTKTLKNNQFRSTVIFNGLDFVGRPSGSKKKAEKDAAAQALLWLKGEDRPSSDNIDHVSMLLSGEKRRSKRRYVDDTKWG